MAFLHEAVTTKIPARPTLVSGVGRPVVAAVLPAPKGIRRPDPASGEGVLAAEVRINNRTPNAGVGVLKAVFELRIPGPQVAEGTLQAHVFQRVYMPVPFSGAGGSSASGVPRFDRLAFLSSQGESAGNTFERYTRPATDSGIGSLTAVATSKLDRLGEGEATGTLTVATSAEGAIYATEVSIDADGNLDAAVKPSVTASLEGNGVTGILEAEFAVTSRANGSGSGSLSASAQQLFPGISYGSGAGELLGTAAPKFTVGGTGTGSLTAPVKSKHSGVLSGEGSLTANAFGRTFSDMQMTKTGNQSISGTYARITGMGAEAGYPETVVVDNALVVSGSTSNATVDVHLVGTKSSTSYMVYSQVLVNGVLVGSEQVKSGSPNSFTFDFQFTGVTLADGDVLELQARRSGTASVLAGTFVRITA